MHRHKNEHKHIHVHNGKHMHVREGVCVDIFLSRPCKGQQHSPNWAYIWSTQKERQIMIDNQTGPTTCLHRKTARL